jgi:hypothetical protein
MKPRYRRINNWVCSYFIVSSATPTTMRIAVPPNTMDRRLIRPGGVPLIGFIN